MRPFFRHYGGKWLLSRRLPPPRTGLPIIEPFAGGAGYSVRYGEGRRVMLYDIDPDTCAIWDWLLGASVADVMALPVWRDATTDVRTLGLERGAMLLLQRWLTPQGSRTNWRMPPGVVSLASRAPGSMWGESARGRIARQLPGLSRWSISCAAYDAAPNVDATWVIDPPYQSNSGGRYACGCVSAVDYVALGAWCRTRRGMVIVHEQDGADWLPFDPFDPFAAGARTGRFDGGKMKRRDEVLWGCDGRQLQLPL